MIDETVLELINRRRRQILAHSFLYYQMSTSIIADHTFDRLSKELADLQVLHPEEAAAAIYAADFASFDGSSGYDLPFYYPEVQSKALQLLRIHQTITTRGTTS